MLLRLLLLFLLGVFLAAVLRLLYLRYQPSARQLLVTGVLTIALLTVLALVAAGRLHWLAGAAAVLLPFAGKLLGTLGMWHLLRRLQQGQQDGHDHGGNQGSGGRRQTGTLSRAEALDILGLSGQPDRASIVAAHRRLMQKYHPDHGGSEYFAARINAAKERLLADL